MLRRRPATALVRLTTLVGVALGALLALASAALGADGEGLYGRTDDKVITFFAFGVMAFFVVLVITLSLIQIRLDNRKERRKADLERLGSS
jgi:putative copper export protein